MLSAYGVGFTHPQVAEELAGLGSFVCLPFLPVWVRYGLLARCPTLQPDIVWIDARYEEAKDGKPAKRGSAIDLLIDNLTRNLGFCEKDIMALKNPFLFSNAPAAPRSATRTLPEKERLKPVSYTHLTLPTKRIV